MLNFNPGDLVELKSGNVRYKVLEDISEDKVICTGYDGHSICFDKVNLRKVELSTGESVFPIQPTELVISLSMITAVFLMVLLIAFAPKHNPENPLTSFLKIERTFALENVFSVSPGTIEVNTDGTAPNKWKETDVFFQKQNGEACTLENIRIKDNLDLDASELYLYESSFYFGRYYLTDRNLGQKVEWL